MIKTGFIKYTSTALGGLLIFASLTGCDIDPGPDTAGVHGSHIGGDTTATDISGYTCHDCHFDPSKPMLNPLLIGGSGTDGKHEAHYNTVQMDCERCHMGYTASETHLNIIFDAKDPSVAIVNFDSLNPSGEWIKDTGPATGQCYVRTCHGPYEPEWYGTAGAKPRCEACHLLSEAASINPLLSGGSGSDGKHALHYETRRLRCEKCHMSYYYAPTHNDQTFDSGDPLVNSVFFDATNPVGFWNSDVAPATGQCASTDCHNPDTLNWYDATTWSTPGCVTCHPMPMGVRRTVMGASGDFAENASMATFHVVNSVDPADAQCLICHDQVYHMAGTILLSDADTGALVPLSPYDLSSAEPFCLSCHDSDGANGDMTPFDDGNELGVVPYKMSAEIKDRWNRAYGHQRKGLTCIGTGEPNTGCHRGGHGSEFAGLLAKKLAMPLPFDWGSFTPAKEPNYALCLECHENYPNVTKEVILGARAGGNYDLWGQYWWYGAPTPYDIPNILTKFSDKNVQGSGELYDDEMNWGQYWNLHFFHLDDPVGSWFYRGVVTGWWAPTSCIACHDMHGSDTPWGFLYDEFKYARYYGSGSDEYGQMDINPLALPQHPINCSSTFNCHKNMYPKPTHNWFSPPNE